MKSLIKISTLILALFLVGCAYVRGPVVSTSVYVQSYKGNMQVRVNKWAKLEGLPSLKVDSINKGDVLKVEYTFWARTTRSTRGRGFYYRLVNSDPELVEPKTGTDGLFQSVDGWQSCTMISYYQAKRRMKAGEELKFDLEFAKVDISGTGQIRNVLFTGEVLPEGKVKFVD